MRVAVALALALLVAACGSSESPPRCDTCGMQIVADDGWRAGAEGLAFDAPKCLFRHRHRHGALTEPWVIEYYGQTRRPAGEMLYVTGTDLQSPMGRDLVPVEGREAAERMQRDHGGDAILEYDEVSEELVEGLFR